MKRELEKKFSISNQAEFLLSLEALGIFLGNPIEQRDAIYFRKGKGFSDLPSGEPVLRIRQAGTSITTTLKVYRNGVSDRTEVECGISDALAFNDYLRCIEFEKVVEVVKIRRKAEFLGAKVVLDDVLQLGTFAEVEVVTDDDSVSEGLELLATVVGRLGLDMNMAVTTPYDEMLYRRMHGDAANVPN